MRVFFARLGLWLFLVGLFTWWGVARLNYPGMAAWEALQRTLWDLWGALSGVGR